MGLSHRLCPAFVTWLTLASWEADVNERLGGIMTRSFQDVLSLSKQHRVNMRTAAYMLSISRVATVHRLRGIYA